MDERVKAIQRDVGVLFPYRRRMLLVVLAAVLSAFAFAGNMPAGWMGVAWAGAGVLEIAWMERERRQMRRNVDFVSLIALEATGAFRSICDAAPAVIWTSDPTGAVTFANLEALRFFGAEDAASFDWRTYVHPVDLLVADVYLAQVQRLEEPPGVFLRVRRHDGAWRWMFAVSRAHGDPVRALISFWIDATAWKDAEHELAELIESKQNFLSVMSHELRTPLTAILGYVLNLKEGLPAALPPEDLEVMDRVEEAANRLLLLVDQVLLFNRLESAGLRAAKAPMDPAAAVLAVQATLLPRARALNLRIAVDTTYAPAALVTDDEKVRRALLNLVSNALKFTKEGTITMRVVETPTHVEFVVEDPGIGIDADTQRIMFEPLWQARQSMVREVGGMGLGLAVCRRIAELLGGSITVDSREGAGSTFTLCIPK